MESEQVLIVLVDEFGKAKPGNLRGHTLRDAMNVMDEFHGTVAFIFSALVIESVDKWKGLSGRAIYMFEGVNLTSLNHEDTVLQLKSILKSGAAALLENPKIQRELRQCFGHPR